MMKVYISIEGQPNSQRIAYHRIDLQEALEMDRDHRGPRGVYWRNLYFELGRLCSESGDSEYYDYEITDAKTGKKLSMYNEFLAREANLKCKRLSHPTFAVDIGLWGIHRDQPLSHVLMNVTNGVLNIKDVRTTDVQRMVSHLHKEKFGNSVPEALVPRTGINDMYGRSNSCRYKIPGHLNRCDGGMPVLTERERKQLITFIEERSNSVDAEKYREKGRSAEDFVTVVDRADLEKLLGTETMLRLKQEWESVHHNGEFTIIKMRKVEARDGVKEPQHCINFHLDQAYETMGIALNDPQDYVGGKLVYALENGKLITPSVQPGVALHHDYTVVHGVTKLEQGKRYHLFFLRT